MLDHVQIIEEHGKAKFAVLDLMIIYRSKHYFPSQKN